MQLATVALCRDTRRLGVGLLLNCLSALCATANPVGGTVTHGSATFSSQGSQFTIRTSDRAVINWQSFNIGLGQTTTFIQPTSSSLVWNQINDPNPSQILGNLNANGYVVLQNQAGFFIGGQASITTHGLMMTTAPIPMPDLSAGSAWDFRAPPPTASILNYGQVKTDNGGSVFLIANQIENHGTISAPQGQVGLFAGQDVLVSERPDGRGLSARVTMPSGSVDNSGKIIADAGSIMLHAQVVNQGGLVQANSVREVNGHIELVASQSLNLGPQSVISAKGDTEGNSAGGSVLIRSEGSFTDQPGSVIDISGGSQGGNGGQAEISAPVMSSIRSRVDGTATGDSVGGQLTIDPLNIVLAGSGDQAPSSGQVGPTDPPAAGTLTLDVSTFSKSLSKIILQAMNNIEVSTVWTLDDPGVPASLNLTAGNNIILDDGAAIKAGNNWSVNLAAGAQLPAGSRPTAGNDGIYLRGNSYIQTRNGS
ncbi:MAG TPA: filamentous hemagglutinin N-terminal domain-containing protein, partial [Verrucomicrobiae bacterium]|nr:filamentous hemagglutinin N-terminal domain-containing protein [Verrucomicrobiae bacterium]